jgi:hypothetical protein
MELAPAVGLGGVPALLRVTYTYIQQSRQPKSGHTRALLEPTLSLLFAGNFAGKLAVFGSSGRFATSGPEGDENAIPFPPFTAALAGSFAGTWGKINASFMASPQMGFMSAAK